jgi:chemotaxis protein MotB
MNATSGVLPFNSNKTSQSEGKDEGTEKEQNRDKQIQLQFLSSVAADFYRLLHLDKDLQEKPIDVQVTTDGLRVTLFDRAKQPLFVANTAAFTEWGTFIMQNLAWTIDRHHFRVAIDGHTKASIAFKDANYSSWELSADRANSARRSLVHFAVDAALIERVTGYADTRPLKGEKPEAETNQRVTISLTLSATARFKNSTFVDQPVPVSVTARESRPTS